MNNVYYKVIEENGIPESVPVLMDRNKAKKAAKMMKFTGIIQMITGIYLCIGMVITIPIGVLLIVAARELVRCASRIDRTLNGDLYSAERTSDQLAEYIKKTGIAVLIQTVITFVLILLYVLVIISGSFTFDYRIGG